MSSIIPFNTRMGLFFRPSGRANVVAFLHGYEYAYAEQAARDIRDYCEV